MELKKIVEGILFAANRPLSCKQIQAVFPQLEQPTTTEIRAAVLAISEDYKYRAIELKKVASGYRFQVRAELSLWVSRLFAERPPKYSRALLETLTIIAYRQPITRADIEAIRGVSLSQGIVQTLLERDWIRVVAYKTSPGRPGLYGTTTEFLNYFNLQSLADLPAFGFNEQQQFDLSAIVEDTDAQLDSASETGDTFSD